MGQILRRQIPVVNGLVGILAGKVEIQDVVDTLLSSVINVPLSAKQGKTLEDKKMERVDVINGLLSTSGVNPLSAGIGRELASIFESKVSSTSIENGLGSDDTERVLAAAQGKILHDMVSGRQDGMEYGGVIDLSDASNLPSVDKGGFLYVISASGALNGLLANAGDMIVSNGVTYVNHPEDIDPETGDVIIPAYTEYLASSWDVIDSSENPDILRIGDKQITPAQVTKLAVGGIVKSLIDAMLEEVRAAKRYLVCDAGNAIADNKFSIDSKAQDNCVVGDMVYVDMLDGTYDEWEGVSIDNQEITLVGANGKYDGKEAKVSYFGVLPSAPVNVTIGYATDDKTNRVFEILATGGATASAGGNSMTLHTWSFTDKQGNNAITFDSSVPVYPEGTVLNFRLISGGNGSTLVEPVEYTVPADGTEMNIRLLDGLEGEASDPRWYPAGTGFAGESDSNTGVDYLWSVGAFGAYTTSDAYNGMVFHVKDPNGQNITTYGGLNRPFNDGIEVTVLASDNSLSESVNVVAGTFEYSITMTNY